MCPITHQTMLPRGSTIQRARVPYGPSREEELAILRDATRRVLAVMQDPRTDDLMLVVADE